MKVGDVCYIIMNNRVIEEVVITQVSGNLYTLRFMNRDKAIRLPKHRLYNSLEETKKVIGIVDIEHEETKRIRPPMRH